MSTSRFALAALCVLVAALVAGVKGSAQPNAAVGAASARQEDGILNIHLPGLLTAANIGDDRLRAFGAHGYDWITYQVQNGGTIRDFDLAPAKAAGLSAGVWGVSYDQPGFFADGLALGRQAVKLGAQHVTMNVEIAAKRTQASRGMKPIIDGLRAAGWTGAVNLNTLGPPVDPEANDYELDLVSFLETGGGVMTQAYFNETDHYRPSRAARYYTRVGVPRDKLNLNISVMPSESDKQKAGTILRGARYVPLLKEARLGKAFSIFLAEAVTTADLRALDKVIRAPAPKPGTNVDVSGNRAEALERLAASISGLARERSVRGVHLASAADARVEGAEHRRVGREAAGASGSARPGASASRPRAPRSEAGASRGSGREPGCGGRAPRGVDQGLARKRPARGVTLASAADARLEDVEHPLLAREHGCAAGGARSGECAQTLTATTAS